MSRGGCLTCKTRKIGCDKTRPSCNNCLRTGRVCAGYGVRLSWPEDGDGRRRRVDKDAPRDLVLRSKDAITNYGRVDFLNTTTDDLLEYSTKGFSRIKSITPTLPLAPSSGYVTGIGDDCSLLSYYLDRLSRMITTVDDSRNGFRTVLIPLSASNAYPASASLRQAILALASGHLHRRAEASQFKLNAIRLLSQSLGHSTVDEETKLCQFATCMMLCVGDVFDSADQSWHAHLKAAQTIASSLSNSRNLEALSFLRSWLAYHAILSEFSSGKAVQPTWTNPKMNERHDSTIIGALGCSMELMDIISCINSISLKQTGAAMEGVHQDAAILLMRLENLDQVPVILQDENTGNIDMTRIINTAELYRLAALLYLLARVPFLSIRLESSEGQASTYKQSVINNIFKILRKIPICTSPWPVFILGCEVEEDNHRLELLGIIEKMQSERQIGNIDTMRAIIEGIWKQMDLQKVESDHTLLTRFKPKDWRKLIAFDKEVPSFI